MQRNKAVSYAGTLLGIILIGLFLQLAGSHSSRLIFPGIGAILNRFMVLIGKGETWRMILTTLVHLLAALLISTLLGILTGSLMGLFPPVRRLFTPLLACLRSLPMIVLVIIIMVLNRYRNVPVIATTLVLFPLFCESCSEGIRRIDQELLDVYRINGSFSPRVFVLVHLPLMTGYIRQSYQNAVGMGIKVAVTSEYLVQAAGSLGKAVFSSFYFSEYADIYAYALIMILLVMMLTEVPGAAVRLIRKRKGITTR